MDHAHLYQRKHGIHIYHPHLIGCISQLLGHAVQSRRAFGVHTCCSSYAYWFYAGTALAVLAYQFLKMRATVTGTAVAVLGTVAIILLANYEGTLQHHAFPLLMGYVIASLAILHTESLPSLAQTASSVEKKKKSEIIFCVIKYKKNGLLLLNQNQAGLDSERSLMVGLTSFCYVASFPWGGWSLWLLQAFLSFMSDYVYIGHDSRFHVLDRLLARRSARCSSRWRHGRGYAGTKPRLSRSLSPVTLQADWRSRSGTFACSASGTRFGTSVRLALVSVLARNCDFIFDDACAVKRVGILWCDCWSSHRPGVELVLFACSLVYAAWALRTRDLAPKMAVALLA